MALIINKEFISCASKSTAHLAYCLTLHCSVFKEHVNLLRSYLRVNSFYMLSQLNRCVNIYFV